MKLYQCYKVLDKINFSCPIYRKQEKTCQKIGENIFFCEFIYFLVTLKIFTTSKEMKSLLAQLNDEFAILRVY